MGYNAIVIERSNYYDGTMTTGLLIVNLAS